jgi:hypothetical protein
MTCNLAISYQTIRHHIPGDIDLHSRRREKPKSHIVYTRFTSTNVPVILYDFQNLRHFLDSATWLQILTPPLQLQKQADLRAQDFAHSAMLWHQPRLPNVTCAWRWRLCGINPANILSYATFWTVSGIWQMKRISNLFSCQVFVIIHRCKRKVNYLISFSVDMECQISRTSIY